LDHIVTQSWCPNSHKTTKYFQASLRGYRWHQPTASREQELRTIIDRVGSVNCEHPQTHPESGMLMKHQPVRMKRLIPDKTMSNRWYCADFMWASQKLSRAARCVGFVV
jgi:hypothetical protein